MKFLKHKAVILLVLLAFVSFTYSVSADSSDLSLFFAHFNDGIIPQMSQVQQVQGSAAITTEDGYVKMDVPSGSANLYPGADIPAGHNIVVVELDLMQASDASKIRAVQAYDSSSKRTTLIQVYNLRFHVNGVRYVNWSANTWHSVKVVFDFDSQKHHVYDNGTLLTPAEGVPFYDSTAATGTSGFKYFQIAAEAGTNYIDNIRISSYLNKEIMNKVTEIQQLVNSVTVGNEVGNYPQSAVDYVKFVANKVMTMESADAEVLAELEQVKNNFAGRQIKATDASAPIMNDIVINTPLQVIIPPLGYTNKAELTVNTFDQFGSSFDGDVVYSVLCSEDKAAINSQTGELEVFDTAQAGEIVVKVCDSTNPLVCAVKSIALADGVWIAEESVDVNEESVTMKFKTIPATALDIVGYTIKAPDNSVLDSDFISSNENGEFIISLTIPQGMGTGDYSYNVWSDGSNEINSTFRYIDEYDRIAVLNAIYLANISTIEGVLTSDAYKDILKLDMAEGSTYYSLQNKTNVLSKIAGVQFSKVHDVVKTFDEAVVLQAVKEVTAESFDSVITSNNYILGLELNNAYGVYKDKLAALFEKYSDDLESINDIKTFYDKSLLICDFNSAVKSNIVQLVTDNLDKLYEYGLNSDYGTATETKRKAACFTIFDKEYEQLEDYIESMNTELERKEATQNRPVSSGGGGGGGAGIKVPVATQTPEIKDEPVTTPTVESSTFTDVADTHWAYNAINRLADKKIINGVGDNKFEPDLTVTREEFIKMLLLSFDIELVDGDSEFSDVCPERWYYTYVITAEKNGFVKGENTDSFGVGNKITRQDAATLLYRIVSEIKEIEADKNTAVTFGDKAEIADYAADAISFVQQYGIMNGVGGNVFDPQGYMTRAMAAKVFDNAMQLSGR